MLRRPPGSTRTATLFPDPTLFRAAGEVLLLAVTPERAEVALDRLPAAAGGDAHALVVVADRTAGGERVVEPVAVLAGDAVGDVREARGALVGGDDRSEEHTSELQSLMRISYAVFCLTKKNTP